MDRREFLEAVSAGIVAPQAVAADVASKPKPLMIHLPWAQHGGGPPRIELLFGGHSLRVESGHGSPSRRKRPDFDVLPLGLRNRVVSFRKLAGSHEACRAFYARFGDPARGGDLTIRFNFNGSKLTPANIQLTDVTLGAVACGVVDSEANNDAEQCLFDVELYGVIPDAVS